jgi:protease-4
MSALAISLIAAGVFVLLVVTRALGNLVRALFRFRRPRWVRLEVKGPLPSRPQGKRGWFSPRPPVSIAELARTAELLAADARVRGVLVVLRAAPDGWARLESLREVLARLRAAGKRVAVHLQGPGTRELLAAAAAETLFVDESAPLAVCGLGVEVTFFGGALDKLGAKAELAFRGKYKSFAESYTRSDMSDAHREAAEAVLDGAQRLAVRWLADGRKLDDARAAELLAGGPYPAWAARANGLVDDVCYLDEAVARWRARLPEAEAKTMPAELPDVSAWLRFRARPLRLPGLFKRRGPRVRVIHFHGNIVDGEGAEWPRPLLGSEPACRALAQARKDPRTAAVVLHVDSRGGSASASDLMWREVVRLAAAKPVIACFDDFAASGGYYLACGARGIVARPGTLTGSIGVVAGKLSAEGLLDKLGLRVERLARGEAAGMFSPTHAFTDEQRRRLEAEVESLYRQFVKKVADGRKRPETDVEPVAQGRVWTGADAAERGLVDRLGGVDDAIRWARELAGLPPPRRLGDVRDVVDVRPLSRRGGLLRRLLASELARLPLVPDALALAELARARHLCVAEPMPRIVCYDERAP